MSGDLLTALSRVQHKNTLSGNFQKSEINTYTWNFDMYDTSTERKEFKLYDELCFDSERQRIAF